MLPMSVFSQRIMCGRNAFPFHAVDTSERLYTSCVPGISLLYLLPETSHERMTRSFLSTAQTRWPDRSYTTRLPVPEFAGSGGASGPLVATNDNGYPIRSTAPAAGGG